MYNISNFNEDTTARTNKEAANIRAEHLSIIGASNVIELCVGPSLKTLEQAYRKFGIQVTGNDIDHRWKLYYPKGNWIIGDALCQNYNGFDSIIFAPPLSYGCTGRREDALQIKNIMPSYSDFIAKIVDSDYDGNIVLVLPARGLSTKRDKEQLFMLLNNISKNFTYDLVEIRCGRRKIRKYIDLYLKRYK